MLFGKWEMSKSLRTIRDVISQSLPAPRALAILPMLLLCVEWLTGEVLESVIAEHHEDAITQTLRTLSAAGCRIVLDDFGTGFTSILNIRWFKVSRLKIDEYLVARLDQEEDQRTLVAALLSFSAKLGIDALAEGVETRSERKVLQNLRRPHIQGFVTARPMPLGEALL
jgi:EAL domain-containing protein (putative c-di-GMP-specific phosphodiesterase class I)